MCRLHKVIYTFYYTLPFYLLTLFIGVDLNDIVLINIAD